jgi:hypothetical protein
MGISPPELLLLVSRSSFRFGDNPQSCRVRSEKELADFVRGNGIKLEQQKDGTIAKAVLEEYISLHGEPHWSDSSGPRSELLSGQFLSRAFLGALSIQFVKLGDHAQFVVNTVLSNMYTSSHQRPTPKQKLTTGNRLFSAARCTRATCRASAARYCGPRHSFGALKTARRLVAAGGGRDRRRITCPSRA